MTKTWTYGQKLLGCALLAAALTSCENKPKDGWYEESSEVDQRKQEFVEENMRHGMDEVQAKRAFGLKYSIENTGRREPVEVSGEQLDVLLHDSPSGK